MPRVEKAWATLPDGTQVPTKVVTVWNTENVTTAEIAKLIHPDGLDGLAELAEIDPEAWREEFYRRFPLYQGPTMHQAEGLGGHVYRRYIYPSFDPPVDKQWWLTDEEKAKKKAIDAKQIKEQHRVMVGCGVAYALIMILGFLSAWGFISPGWFG